MEGRAQDCFEGLDAFRAADGSDTEFFDALAVEVAGDRADFAPEAPVEDLHGKVVVVLEGESEGVLEGGGGGVVALPRITEEGVGGGEEGEEIEGLVAQQI